jgi:hypothetical protein
MSFKAKIAAGAATFALVGGGLGMVSTLSASAATPSCSNCHDYSTHKFHSTYVLDVFHGQASAGNEIILFQRSNSDPAQDFVTQDLGTVGSFYNHSRGLISPGFDQAYHAEEAIQIKYEPLGRNSNFCVGTWPGQAAQSGWKVRLEPCGQTSTIWAVDNKDRTQPPNGYVPLIAGTDTDFSDPLVMNYPAGNPTDMPRPWLNVQPLSNYSNGDVYDNQEWRSAGLP